MIYNNINNFLENNNNKQVIFTCGNFGVFTLIKNLVLSAKKVNVNIVVFAFDKNLVNALENLCDVVEYISGDTEDFCEYGTNDFNKIVFHRFVIGNKLLNADKIITYLDVDIFVKKDFSKEITDLYENTDADCLFQMDGAEILGSWDYNDESKVKNTKKWKNWWYGHSPFVTCKNWWKKIVEKWNGSPRIVCTGFYSMKPSKNTLSLFAGDLTDFLKKHDYQPEWNDQDFFNFKIFRGGIHGGINVKFLDRDEYPNGDWYNRYHSKIDKVCKIIHFNGILGVDAKIDNMKKFGYFLESK